MKLYDHAASANCLKCRVLLRRPGAERESVTVVAPRYGLAFV